MKEELITFETAKLAKKKGFDVLVKSYFYDGDTGTNILREEKHSYYKNYNGVDLCYSITTQSLLQKWLRDEKGIIVLPEDECHPEIWVFNIKSKNINQHFAMESFKTYELALEKGLQEALKLI